MIQITKSPIKNQVKSIKKEKDACFKRLSLFSKSLTPRLRTKGKRTQAKNKAKKQGSCFNESLYLKLKARNYTGVIQC